MSDAWFLETRLPAYMGSASSGASTVCDSGMSGTAGAGEEEDDDAAEESWQRGEDGAG